MSFEYFVVLAEMRTGSNFLEASINKFVDLTCYGELFNPHFVGHHNKDSAFGIDLNAREEEPFALLEKVKAETEGIGGFRLFSDHDPRVLDYVLSDPCCAKVVLTRNPLESYVSLKIAEATGQWKLNDLKQRRAEQITFDDAEFREHLKARRAFQLDIMASLQRSGQTAFYVSYDGIGATEVLNGMARFLGSGDQIDAAAKSTKKQNPSQLEEKVTNYPQMVTALASMDHFALSDIPNFEPQRGPGVPGFYAAARSPVLYIPVAGGPEQAALEWLARLDEVDPAELRTGFSQKELREWKKQRPGHRSFTVLRHPLDRAYHAFCAKVVAVEDDAFRTPRKIMRQKYGVGVPKHGDLASYSRADHKAAFIAFLKFLKGNLAGQTSIRVDPIWASQSSILSGAATVLLPDLVIREGDAAVQLRRLAEDLGGMGSEWKASHADVPYTLDEIYDAELEKLCFQAYRKDYISFGFGDSRSL